MRLSPRDAAARADVSVALIYEWCQSGRLPHYRFGRSGARGKIMIDEADLDEFLATCRVAGPAGDEDGPLDHIR
jgi:excisionase family DNA binding protein